MVECMSVIKSKRKQGRLVVLTKAMEMTKYTVQICKNEKNFPKRDRWLLTQPIVREAVDILCCIRRANAVKVQPGHPEAAAYRRGQQMEAYAHAEAMLSLMEIAYVTLGIEHSRMEHWTGLVVETENLLQAWRKADQERQNPKPAAE